MTKPRPIIFPTRLLTTILLFIISTFTVYASPETINTGIENMPADGKSSRLNFVISGTVIHNPGEKPFIGISLTFPGIGETITDEDGFYEMEVPEGWSGIVVPQACAGAFYDFEPSQITYTNVSSDLSNENYTAETDTVFTISGKITEKNSGEPLANTLVRFSAASTGPPYTIVAETNELGEYSFEQLPCWHDTVNPGVDGYYYLEPFTREYINLSADMTDQDYTFINYEKPIPPNWEYTNTGQAHIIAIQNTAFPNLCGTPLELGDLIGVFYYDENDSLKCGGLGRWQDESNISLIAQGDDNLTPEKDGFSSFEIMNWRVYSYSSESEYLAAPTYKTGGFLSSNNKFSAGGLSIVTSLDAYYPNMIIIPEGWSGLSSYTKPDIQLLITRVMAPILDELILIQDMEKMYYPAAGINNMFVWTYNKGYKIKVSEETFLPMDGCQEPNTTINLSPTWNILPVMSECPVDPVELFSPVISKVLIVKDIAGTGVYWPEMGVNTLDVLEPGRAYYAAVTGSTSVTYGECDPVSRPAKTAEIKTLSSPWGNPGSTGSNHTLAFSAGALEVLNAGDFIGAFSESNMCYGWAQYDGHRANMGLTIFGDDATTAASDGFVSGEKIKFKIFNVQYQEEIDVDVIYDGNYPSADGRYTENGVSVIESLKFSPSGIENLAEGVSIYPNPSTGRVEFRMGDIGEYRISVQNLNGQTMFSGMVSETTQFNFSDFAKGVYVVKIENEGLHSFRKLILK
jgi:hypothetical protein